MGENQLIQIENMAEKFMEAEEQETKNIIIIAMTAYMEGKEAGKSEERKRAATAAENDSIKVS